MSGFSTTPAPLRAEGYRIAPGLRLSSDITKRSHVLWLIALLAATVVVRLADPTGWLGSDDAAYYSAAEQVLTGSPITRLHHHYARMVVILPIAASVALFGHSTAAVAAPMLAASVLCVLVVVLLGRVLWGWREGLAAGIVVSVLPYFRILSTTAFPDVHVCLWATTSMLLAVLASRTVRRGNARILYTAAGFTFGMAVSAKVFAATAGLGIGVLFLQKHDEQGTNDGGSSRRRLPAIASIACGGLLFLLIEGAFYSFQANDFFFSLHAHEHSQAGAPTMAPENDPTRIGVAAMIADRMMLMFRPSSSGWGWMGVFFWPAIVAALFHRGGRSLAAWAGGTYLLIAFAPVSFAGGYQPYPHFHGRHILPACVPFALCLARSLMTISDRVGLAGEGAKYRAWAAAVFGVVVTALGFANPRELSGFRDRPTGRLGDAIRQIASSMDPGDDKPIFMTASTYWRYRILFPESLRMRLRIAVDADAADWWRDTTFDAVGRAEPLPRPDDAYLIATPRQIRGEAETWDYDVPLPQGPLTAWQNSPTVMAIVRNADRKIEPSTTVEPATDPIVVLAGGQSARAQTAAAGLVP